LKPGRFDAGGTAAYDRVRHRAHARSNGILSFQGRRWLMLADAVRLYLAGAFDAAADVCAGLPVSERDGALSLVILGTAANRRGDATQAVELLRKAHRIKPALCGEIFSEALLILGNEFARTNDPDRAEALYWEAAAARPGSTDAISRLGTVLLDRDRLNEAELAFRWALSIDKALIDVRIKLATVLERKGNLDALIAHWQETLSCEPDRQDIHFSLGTTLHKQKAMSEAASGYQRAVALQPDFVEALCSLGRLYVDIMAYGDAERYFRRVLVLDPDHAGANMLLASVLAGDGRLAESAVYLKRNNAPIRLVVDPGPDDRPVALILWANQEIGNTDRLLAHHGGTRIKWYVDCANDHQQDTLPAFDVVYNGVSDADLLDLSIDRIDGFIKRCHRPVLNPPARVALTRRDRMPGLFAGIPNVMVPPVVRLPRAEALATTVTDHLAEAGIGFPLLIRPIVGQSGKGLTLIETPQQLSQHAFSTADAFYFISFHDYQSADGYFRKYRTFFIDRRPYHYHLAISPSWLVHYFSADMLAAPWKREEERRFFEDPASALGQPAIEALEAIGQRMDMDYAAIDYSILPDGRVLAFEANASMLVYQPDARDFPYKQAPTQAVFAAFCEMLDRHAAAPPLSAPSSNAR
jgi:tetratricopeptide (TPR) repeat protein